jgi:hypothetical protein
MDVPGLFFSMFPRNLKNRSGNLVPEGQNPGKTTVSKTSPVPLGTEYAKEPV